MSARDVTQREARRTYGERAAGRRGDGPRERRGEGEKPTLILASASPRRSEILRALGWRIRIVPSGLPEEGMPEGDPVEAAMILALHKAREVAGRLHIGAVLGADTIVHLDGRIMGKPRGAGEAREYLRFLSGKTHRVTTGLALIDAASGRQEVAAETTRVRMHDLSDEEIRGYLESGEPFDKAGAYAIQGKGFILIDKIWGSYTNVIGLPVGRLKQLWEKFRREE